MARPLKIVLGIIGALIALLILAVIAVPLLIDPNDYRDDISATAEQATGRELTVGNIGLSVFPWLKVTLQDVSLANAEGFGEEPFLSAAEASVGVKLWPLLVSQRYEVSTIGIKDARFNLERDRSGKTNWEDLAKASQADAGPETGERAEPAEPEKPPVDIGTRLGKFQLGGIDIDNASLSFDDREAHQKYTLRELRLRTGALKVGQPFDLETSGTLAAEARPIEARFALEASIAPDLAAKKISVDNLKLGIETSEQARKLSAELTGRIAADLASGTLDASGLAITASAAGESVPGGSQRARLAGDLALDRKAGTLRLSSAVLEALGLTLTAEIAGQGLNGEQPSFSGPIAAEPFSPRELLARLGRPEPKSSDPNVLKRLAFNARLSATPASASLQDLKLTVDETNATGRLSLRDFATGRIEVVLDIDQFDADRYLPPKSEAPAVRGERRAQRPVNDAEIDVAGLNQLNIAGTLDLGRLKLRGLDLTDIRLRIDGPRGQPKQARLEANLFGGTIDATTRITPAERSRFALKSDIRSVQLGPLIQAVTGKERITGTGNILLDLSSSGRTVGEIRQGLDGTVSVQLLNGALKGFNLGSLLRRGQAALRSQSYTDDEPKETDFASIEFKGQIVDGVLTSDFLDGKSPLFRVGGAGRIDLFRETFDYTARPTVVATSKGQGGQGLEDLSGVAVPIKITGTWSDPNYRIDVQEALKQKAANRLREGLKEREGEIRERLNGRFGNVLEGLLGGRRKAPPPSEEPKTAPEQDGERP